VRALAVAGTAVAASAALASSAVVPAGSAAEAGTAQAAQAGVTKAFGRYHDAPVDNVHERLLSMTVPAGKYVILGKLVLTPRIFQAEGISCRLSAGTSFDEAVFSRPRGQGPTENETMTFTLLHSSSGSFTARLRCLGATTGTAGSANVSVEDQKITALPVDELSNTPG
jgi:hypothetical protein